MKKSVFKRRRIAVFGMGTIGGKDVRQRIPVLTDLFTRLSERYEIVFYSFSRVNLADVPAFISVRQPTRMRLPAGLKYFLLTLRCGLDHLLNPYHLLFAISIYPTGRWAVALAKFFRIRIMVQLIALEFGAMPEINIRAFLIPWLRKVIVNVCTSADVLITVSEYQQKIAAATIPFRKSFHNLPLRINTRLFEYRELEVSYPVQFIHIAYYSPIKDQDTMFKAFSIVAQKIACHLTVIGDKYDNPKVEKMLKELQIADKVTITGFLPHELLPGYLSRAHILLHMARFETGCAVIQEAMASGVAVCGTRVGLLADIGDEYAAIGAPQAVEELAEKILMLVYDQYLFKKLTRNAYQWISTHDAEWAYRNYERLFEENITR